MKKIILSLFVCSFTFSITAQNIQNNPTSNHGNKFEQLGTILPDANTYRTASGAPGHEYWQQKADYFYDSLNPAQQQKVREFMQGGRGWRRWG